ncbi:murein biosynthesis integral membrane protein MurJ [Lutibacter sp. B2]|nr:murein biosynthesis integral membrane protein MurJ [Lutibacter sp. B2]
MSRNIAEIAIWITIITLSSKFIGFLRDVIMASCFGTSIQTDAFIMSQSIVGVMTGIVLVALNTTFIPVYTDYVVNKSNNEKRKFINVIYTFFIGLFIALTCLGMIFTKQVVFIFAPNFSSEAFYLTVQLTKILLPTITLAGWSTLNNARLQSHNSYLIPAAIGYPVNILMIMTMLFLTKPFGIVGLAISVSIGTLVQILLQWPFIRKLGHKYKIEWDLKEEGLRKIGVLVVPILIGNGIQQINTMVDRMLASGLPEGSVSALNFSNRLVLFIVGLMSAAVASIYYTSMSKYHTEGNDDAFKKLLRNTTNILVLIVLPAMVGFMILRLSIVSLIFERGLFDRNASEMTAVALFFYAIGLLGYSLRDVLSRAFYALKDTKTAMINGSIAVVLNIVISISLVPFLGIGGLALGTSVSAHISTLLLMISLRKKIGDFGLGEIGKTFLKTGFVSSLMGIGVHFGYKFVFSSTGSNTLAVLLSIILGASLYGCLILFMKIEEVDEVKEFTSNKLKLIIKKLS